MPAAPDPPTVLVTGGTSGIGYQTAIGLGRQGAHVVITGRDETRGAQAVATIRSIAGHGRVEFHPADHSTIAGNRQLVARVDTALAEQGVQLDVLINNVGRVFSTRQETADGIEQTLALCMIGPVTLTETLLPTLRSRTRSSAVKRNSTEPKHWPAPRNPSSRPPWADILAQRSPHTLPERPQRRRVVLKRCHTSTSCPSASAPHVNPPNNLTATVWLVEWSRR